MCALKSLMHVTGIVYYISKSVFRHQNVRGGGGGEGSANIFFVVRFLPFLRIQVTLSSTATFF